jgi:hypothetical protein
MNNFIKNNTLLISNKCDIFWTRVGSAEWYCYQQSINETIQSTTVSNTITTPAGSYAGSAAFNGSVLMSEIGRAHV